jgi:tetratricopeptide (TPR) repeat protein
MLNQEDTFDYAWASLNYAIALGFVKDAKDVFTHYQQAFELLKKKGFEKSVVFAGGLGHLGRFYGRHGYEKEAIQYMREGIEILDGPCLNEKGSRVESLALRRDLADYLARIGDCAGAVALCGPLLDETRHDNIAHGQILVILARAKLKASKVDDSNPQLQQEAREFVQQAITLFNKYNPNEPTWLTRQKAQPSLEEAELLLKECA